MVGWGKCRVCGLDARLSDLQWCEILTEEACDDCREAAERGKLGHRLRGPVSKRWLARGIDDHDHMCDSIRNGDDDC